MAKALEDRIIAERAKMRGSEEALRARVSEFARGPRSKALLSKTLDYESIGHLCWVYFPAPPVFEYGEGATVYDVDGNSYLDLHAGFAVNALGHGNEEVNAAISNQMGKLNQFAELPLEPRADLARILCEHFPGDADRKLFFGVTGGEAVEIAMKLSRWYTGKPIIVTFWGDYHGRTAGAMALTSKAYQMAYSWPIPPLDTAVVRIPFPYCYRCPYGHTYPSCDLFCADQLERMFQSGETWLNNPKTGVTNVAAMLIEPFQSSAGYIIPPLEYLRSLREICDRYGVLLVSDEIQAGMGRTGKMWAIEHGGVAPDMLTTAKSLSNGLPMSACIGRREILDSWGPGGHASTFIGYAPACAGGVKVFEIFERDDIVLGAAQKGAYFLEGLKALSQRHPSVGEQSGLGLYLAIELVMDRETKEPATEAAGWATYELLKEGVVCMHSGYYGNRLMFAPPLVISKDQIDTAIDVLDRVLHRTEREFGIPH
jgi:4-aminobutyrate aminotransferase-like enzyme